MSSINGCVQNSLHNDRLSVKQKPVYLVEIFIHWQIRMTYSPVTLKLLKQEKCQKIRLGNDNLKLCNYFAHFDLIYNLFVYVLNFNVIHLSISKPKFPINPCFIHL